MKRAAIIVLILALPLMAWALTFSVKSRTIQEVIIPSSSQCITLYPKESYSYTILKSSETLSDSFIVPSGIELTICTEVRAKLL